MTITRRRVLAAFAAAGGAGALTGGATSALLGEHERGSLALTTGLVDIVVEYWENPASPIDRSHPDGIIDGQHLAVPTAPLDGNDRGRTVLRLSLPQADGPNNPASLWLKSDCPEGTTLAEVLAMTVSYADASGTSTAEIASGSLRSVANTLRTGWRIDGDPTTTTVDCLTDEIFLAIEYDLAAFAGEEAVSLPLTLTATQCRNGDPDANPFPADAIDEVCESAYSCDCCWAIGKVEIDTRFHRGHTYTFDEGLAGYTIHVTDANGESGIAFELVATDDVPLLPLCDVAIKGGPRDVHYSRRDGAFGFDTSVLGSDGDGMLYAPENPASGDYYGISYVLVSVCVPSLASGNCPEPAANGAASVDSEPTPPRDRSGTPDPERSNRTPAGGNQ